MADADFLGRGWKFPVTVENGKIAFSEGEESIKDSIRIILETAEGERVMRPDFGCGINRLAFEPNNTSTTTFIAFHIEEALMKWEPRIEVLDVNVIPDVNNEKNKILIDIDYMIKSTNTRDNLVYPFYLGR
jgi:phage baseplate assembly protein W